MTITPAPAGDPPIVTPPVVEPPAAQTVEQLQAQLAEQAKALKAANRESADRRKRLDDLEAAEKVRVDASLSEIDKLKKQVADAEAESKRVRSQANERLMQAEVFTRAAALNFNDPADAYALIDRSKITIDDAGKVDGADELLAELAKAKPYMLKTGQQVIDTNATRRGTQAGAAITQEEIIRRKKASGEYQGI